MISENFPPSLLIAGAVAALLAGSASGRNVKISSDTVFTVCGTLDGFKKGRAVASQILRQAGVRLEWRNSTKACSDPDVEVLIRGSVGNAVGKPPRGLSIR